MPQPAGLQTMRTCLPARAPTPESPASSSALDDRQATRRFPVMAEIEVLEREYQEELNKLHGRDMSPDIRDALEGFLLKGRDDAIKTLGVHG